MTTIICWDIKTEQIVRQMFQDRITKLKLHLLVIKSIGLRGRCIRRS